MVKNFINGIVTIVPIILVVYVVIKVFRFLDSLAGNFVKDYMQEKYVPGMGLIVTIILITVLGWLSRQYISGKIVAVIDKLFDRIPFVKSLYSIIKETTHSLLGEKKSFSKVALVRLPGTEMKVLGFITSEELESFDGSLKDHLAVYVPQTFQVAGFTFLIPVHDIEILDDVKAEDAMKFILSGGMGQSKKDDAKKP